MPTTGYSGMASFTYSITDGKGGTASASVGLLVNDPSTVSLFNPTSTPSIVTVNDPNSIELGMEFQASTNGDITGIRFYKGPQNTGPHVADLWNATGTLLARATFTNETASGWEQANFATPVAIRAGTTILLPTIRTATIHPIPISLPPRKLTVRLRLSARSRRICLWKLQHISDEQCFKQLRGRCCFRRDAGCRHPADGGCRHGRCHREGRNSQRLGRLARHGNVLTNDTDPDAGDTKTVTAVSFGAAAGTLGTALAGAHGSLVLNAAGDFTYTVNETDAAVQALRQSTDTLTDAFSYTMRDTAGATSSTTLTVTIHGANDAPTLAVQTGSQNAIVGSAFSLVLPAGTFTDVDAGDTLSYTATAADGSPLPAWLTFNAATSTFSGTPTAADIGTLGVKVSATDLGGLAASETFNIAVAPPLNTPPTAVADTADATEKGGIANGSGGSPASGNVLTNDTDPDAGDTKTVTAVSFGAAAGTLGTALAGAHGSLVLDAAGDFTYTVNETDAAVQALRQSTDTLTDAFSYTMRDTAGATSSTTLTVTIHGANDAPTLAVQTGSQNAIVGSAFSLVLPAGTFTDVDAGDTLSYTATAADGSPLPAWLTFNAATRTFSGTPTAADVGTLGVKVSATDLGGLAASETFNIAVAPPLNTPPTAVADTADATEKGGIANGSGGSPASGNVLTNDTDPDAGDTKTVTAVSFGAAAGTLGTALAGAHGSLVLNAAGDFTYTVNETDAAVQALRQSTDTLTDAFSYTMRDTAGATSSTTLTVTIHGANDAPTISNLAVGATSIAFVASDPDNATLSLASPFASAFGNPLITSGATTSLTPSAQTTAVSGTLQVTDGSYTADVVGLYLGTAGNNTATAPNSTAPNAMYGFGGNDTLTGGAAADSIFGGAGADTLSGGAGNDTFFLANGDFASGESIDGGADTDAIVLTNATTVNFTSGTVSNVETLTGSSGNDTVTMSANQWAGFNTINLGGGTNVLNVVASGDISAGAMPTVSNVTTGNLTGTSGNDSITLTGAQLDAIIIGAGTINLGAGTDTINLTSTSADLNTLGATNASIQGVEAISAATAGAGVTITLSGQTEGFTITGSSGADTITGGSGNDNISGGAGADVITGGGGADTLSGGAGNDTFNLANGDFASGESIDGGADTDAIVLTNATTVNFTSGTVSNVETLTGSSGNDTVTMSANQLTGFNTINLGGGTNVLNVVASGDISAATTPTVSNVTTGNLTGTSGNDSITLTGAQLDAIIIGAGTINLGAGTDTINLTSTSADLNTLGATNASIQGVEAISAATAGAGVTITLSGQTEGFTITGSANNDTITGGRGADTITGGAGVDRFVFNSGSSRGTVGGSGDAGTITGYDVITDFSANAGGDILDMPNVNVRANETVNGTNSVLTIGGQTIKSHQINNGIITFSSNDTFSSGTTFSLTSLANVAAAVDYIHRNDFATSTGANIGFVANIGGTPHTYIFDQVGNNR